MKQQNKEIKDLFLIEFGKNVKRLRKKKKLTQIELANRINGDAKKISRIEKGEYNFGIASLLIVAQVLEVDLLELFNIKNIDYFKNNILEDVENE